MNRKIKALAVGLAIAGSLLFARPAMAQGPVNGLASWERNCLSVGACRWYANYSYDNYRWARYDIYPQMRQGYNAIIDAGAYTLTPKYAN
jgi:hypothetical protein